MPLAGLPSRYLEGDRVEGLFIPSGVGAYQRRDVRAVTGHWAPSHADFKVATTILWQAYDTTDGLAGANARLTRRPRRTCDPQAPAR
ncbi:hypothetical protein ADENT20671_0291 [Actinomyces denticolens]|nr:hypothetical protein ADENT20671_0291 [Actinomyces denticolens]